MEGVFNCPYCGCTLPLDVPPVGRKVKCSSCGREIAVPNAEDAAPPAAEEPCQHCGAPLAPTTIVCVRCGYDRRTRRMLGADSSIEMEPAAPLDGKQEARARTFGRMLPVIGCLIPILIAGGVYLTIHLKRSARREKILKNVRAYEGTYRVDVHLQGPQGAMHRIPMRKQSVTIATAELKISGESFSFARRGASVIEGKVLFLSDDGWALSAESTNQVLSLFPPSLREAVRLPEPLTWFRISVYGTDELIGEFTAKAPTGGVPPIFARNVWIIFTRTGKPE